MSSKEGPSFAPAPKKWWSDRCFVWIVLGAIAFVLAIWLTRRRGLFSAGGTITSAPTRTTALTEFGDITDTHSPPALLEQAIAAPAFIKERTKQTKQRVHFSPMVDVVSIPPVGRGRKVPA